MVKRFLDTWRSRFNYLFHCMYYVLMNIFTMTQTCVPLPASLQGRDRVGNCELKSLTYWELHPNMIRLKKDQVAETKIKALHLNISFYLQGEENATKQNDLLDNAFSSPYD